MPLTFNTILEQEGISPENTQIIRHSDKRIKDKTLFDAWHSERDLFEKYQSFQRPSKRFTIGGYLASFVVTRTRETVFVGLYKVITARKAEERDRAPVLGIEVEPDDIVHELENTSLMLPYVGRLIIEPWRDAINHVKKATDRNPEVRELRRQTYDEPFPGLLRFKRNISDMANIFPSWQERLREARGVYLLVCRATGHQYVGSATGQDGFFGRWLQYATDGHGGNVRLVARENSDYEATILEVAGSRDTSDEILELEKTWKAKLGSRVHGLNGN
jgi:hypothetical protein